MGRMLVTESDTPEPPRCRMNTTTTSPVEYVRSLSPEDKEAVLAELIREVIQLNGGTGLITIQAPDGESLGYYIPPEAASKQFDHCGPELTEADRARTNRALTDLGRTFDIKEFFAELRREDERLG
jgi:hypothetical protein